MKISSYPKNLDAVVIFDDCRLIFSENPNYDTKFVKIKGNVKSCYFPITNLVDPLQAVTTVYTISIKNDECCVTVKDTLVMTGGENGILFKLNEKDVDIKKTKTLITLLGDRNYSFIEAIATISFNSHRNRLGFKDIFLQLHSDYSTNGTPSTESYSCLLYYYYYSTPEMYAVAERLIKLGMASDIRKYNPVISGVPIPDVSSFKSLSKVSMDIIKTFERDRKESMDLFEKLEKNPNIGVNGIKMINDMITLYQQIDLPYTCNCRSFRIGWYNYGIFEGFEIITNQFNITTKNLINKMIKASFYENLSPSEYIQLVVDYVRISKLLNLTIPSKMPKDIVKDHDLISAQYKYVKDKIVEKQFIERVKENKLLLKSLPKNEHYTIISPETPNDLIEEGLKMRHCVGTYVNSYAAGNSKIFFVRNKDDINTPCVTLELGKTNGLKQARSFANSNPSKDILEFIDEWVNMLR